MEIEIETGLLKNSYFPCQPVRHFVHQKTTKSRLHYSKQNTTQEYFYFEMCLDSLRVKVQILYVNPCDMKLCSVILHTKFNVVVLSLLLRAVNPEPSCPISWSQTEQLWGMGQLFSFTTEQFDMWERRKKAVLTQKYPEIFQHPHSSKEKYCAKGMAWSWIRGDLG